MNAHPTGGEIGFTADRYLDLFPPLDAVGDRPFVPTDWAKDDPMEQFLECGKDLTTSVLK